MSYLSYATNPSAECVGTTQGKDWHYCDGKTTVWYNGCCRRRNALCGNGNGYLGQTAGNLKYGVCVPIRGKNLPAHQTNQCPPGLATWQYLQRGCKDPSGGTPGPAVTPSLIGHAIGRTSPPGTPAGAGQPKGIGASESCGGCNPLDVGCAIGKQFCEFQGWLAKNLGQMAVPVAIGGGLVIILLLVKR